MKTRTLIILALICGMVFIGALLIPSLTPTHKDIVEGKVTVHEGVVDVRQGRDSNTVKKGEEIVIGKNNSYDESPITESSLISRMQESERNQENATNSEIEPSTSEMNLIEIDEYTLAGYIMSKEGQFIANAVISASAISDGASPKIIETRSNQDGYFLLALHSPGTYEFTSSPADSFLQASTVTIFSASSKSVRHDFFHEKAELVLRGIIVEQTNQEPIADAKVTLSPKPGEVSSDQEKIEAFSGTDGRFIITGFSEGVYSLSSMAPGYVPHLPRQKYENINPYERIVLNTETPQKEYKIELQKGFMAIIQAIDETGNPVPDATVKIAMKGDYRKVEGKTDNNGEFYSDTLLPVESAAVVEKQPYGPSVSNNFQPSMSGKPTTVKVVMKPAASISGRVTYKKGMFDLFSEPRPAANYSISGFNLQIKNQLGGMSSGGMGGMVKVKTDQDGYYTLSPLGEGPNHLFISAKYYHNGPLESREVHVGAGETVQNIDFQIEEEEEGTETVSGTVYDQKGQPIPRANINLNMIKDEWGDPVTDVKNSYTDTDGKFHFSKLMKGDICRLAVTADGYKNFHKDYDMPSNSISIQLEPAGSIHGIVIDKSSGMPLPEAVVFLSVLDIRPISQKVTTADSQGKFVFHGVTGHFGISAESDGYVRNAEFDLHVQPGQDVHDVVIEIEPGLEVTGRVINQQQQPVAGAVIGLLSKVRNHRPNVLFEFSPPSYDDTVISAPDGSFRVQGISPHGDTLVIMHSNFAPVTHHINPQNISSEDVMIWMTTGGQVEGNVYDENQKPLRNVKLFAFNYPNNLFSYHAITDNNGYYRIEHLPESEFTLRCKTSNSAKPQLKKARIIEGGSVRIDFGAGNEYVIRGTVFKNGQPLSGVSIALLAAESFPHDLVELSETVTSESGQYELTGFPEGEYIICFAEPSLLERQVQISPLRVPQQRITITDQMLEYTVNKNL